MKRKRIIRTQFNPSYGGSPQPLPDTSSITVPDQNMGIRNLLDKHSRGLPLGASQKQGEYFDTEIPRFDDLTDMIEYREMLANKHKELESQIKADQANAKAKEEALEKQSEPVPTETKDTKNSQI
tara:strand:+ start:1031 stop:1405 length:375 start_codon:yes stop_codon:yes gene_type:complete